LSESVKSPANIENLLEEILRRVSQDAEYLTIDDIAARLKCGRKTILNRMSAGIYREGVHYFRPEGTDKVGRRRHCDPLFKWSAIVAWVEGEKIKDNMVFPVAREKD
jgi:hypothetical protein